MSLANTLKNKGAKLPDVISPVPVWKGPLIDGITQSFINERLFCLERHRIHVIDGLISTPAFEARIEYGSMWHILEECHASPPSEGRNGKEELLTYCKELAVKYPFQQDEINKWYKVALVQFPIYVNYWKNEKDVVTRKPLFQEEEFKVRYVLPSKRVVHMLGKFDSVDIIGKGIYLQENKTKYEIDEQSLTKQLYFDLQTMYYLVALLESKDKRITKPILGVRYNVIRRPLSGGLGSIRQHKATKNKPAETSQEYYARLSSIIEENAPTFFSRWKVDVDVNTVNEFKMYFLNPMLENVLDDYEWWSFCKLNGVSPFSYLRRQKEFPKHVSRHYRLPYGIYNPIAEGRSSNLDNYLMTGSTLGLEVTDKLFPELQGFNYVGSQS